MIQFVKASKTLSLPQSGAPDKKTRLVILDACSAAIPSSMCASVESESSEVRSTFLQIVFGSIKPDKGCVIADKVRISPVLNLEGATALLVPSMTVRDNINFQARLAHIKSKLMVDFVCSFCDGAEVLNTPTSNPFCDCAKALDTPVNKLKFPMRRAIEAGIIAMVDYDCLLVDHFDLLPDFVRTQLCQVAKERGAGLFFTTTNPGVAKRIRESTIEIADGKLTLETAA